MCVIMVANQGVRPTEEMVKLGWETNKFGGGVAWQEDGQVKWVKGLDEDEMQEWNKKLPFPYVLHFRVPSGGTSTLPGVCHPFPIEGKVSLALKGANKTGVLFHNGFWTNWKDKLTTAAINSRFRLPPGSWSDTRGLAWMASHFGFGVLELIDEKVIVMTPKTIHTFGNGWSIENEVLVSNLQWKTGRPNTGGGAYHMTGPAHWQGRGKHINQGSSEVGPVVGSFRRPGVSGNDQCRLPGGEDQSKKVEAGATENRAPVTPSQAAAAHKEVAAVVVPPSQADRLEEAAWARQLGSQGRKFTSSSAAYPYHPDMKCHDCKLKKADIWEHGHRRCWDCWDSANTTKDELAAKNPNPVAVLTGKVRESTCNFCAVNRAIHRTEASNKWMCNQCWIHNDRPKLKNAEEEMIPVPQQESGSIH